MAGVTLRPPSPDFGALRRVLRGEVRPAKVRLAELLFDEEIKRAVTEEWFGEPWTPLSPESREAYWTANIRLWHRLGYDYIRVSRGLAYPKKSRTGADTAALSRGERAWTEEGTGIIADRGDFERYPWPKVSDIDFSRYEFVSKRLPEGMKMMVSPCAGVFETVAESLLGFDTLSYLMADDPALVEDVFRRVGELHEAFYRAVVQLDNVGGFFQGEDLGFKTGTFLSPDAIRKLVLPWHRRFARIAAEHDGMYWLHSCGDVSGIMEDLIADVRIDAFHSFQDEILPVGDFCRRHGERVAALGGVDVGALCRMEEPELRRYLRRIIEECGGGRFALGTGNSVANYVPLPHYRIMLEEAGR